MILLGSFNGVCMLLLLGATFAFQPTAFSAEPDARTVERTPEGQIVVEGPAGLLGKLPPGVVVHAVGTYRGPTDLPDVQLDQSGNRVGRAEVVVNVPEKPVVLVLTAYDPTVWRVGRTPQTKIAGVIVSGYHAQALVGVDKNTPHAISTYENKGNFRYFYAYKASPELLRMNDTVKRLVGREIERFVNRPVRGVFYVGDPPPEGAPVSHSDDLRVENFVDKKQRPAGQKGLEQLVQQGALRAATPADIEAWVDKASEKYKRFNPDLRLEDHRMRVGRTFVVLKELTLPDGLFGAHSRAFIVPDGIPIPGGPAGHNEFYLMDGTSKGPGSRAAE